MTEDTPPPSFQTLRPSCTSAVRILPVGEKKRRQLIFISSSAPSIRTEENPNIPRFNPAEPQEESQTDKEIDERLSPKEPAESNPAAPPAISLADTMVALSSNMMALVQDGSLIYINPAGIALLGHETAETLAGYSMADIITPEDLPRLEEEIGLILEDGKESFLAFRRQDGSDVPVALKAQPLDDEGHFSYIIEARDISVVKRLESNLILAEQKADQLSGVDATTGLTNMNLFQDRLDRAIIRATRAAFGKPESSTLKIALFMLNLDNYETLRDRLGDEAADNILRTVGMRMASSFRQKDTLVHGEGASFLIVLEDLMAMDNIEIVARRTLGLLFDPVPYKGEEYPLETSLGISIFPTNGITVAGLLENAQLALRSVQEDGGMHYQFYDHSMRRRFMTEEPQTPPAFEAAEEPAEEETAEMPARAPANDSDILPAPPTQAAPTMRKAPIPQSTRPVA